MQDIYRNFVNRSTCPIAMEACGHAKVDYVEPRSIRVMAEGWEDPNYWARWTCVPFLTRQLLESSPCKNLAETTQLDPCRDFIDVMISCASNDYWSNNRVTLTHTIRGRRPTPFPRAPRRAVSAASRSALITSSSDFTSPRAEVLGSSRTTNEAGQLIDS